ncbi:MAG: ECF RNA polymerase sigma factor SigW [Tenericutes bacterium ADurb.Bin239]|nr:MAG: ECF RNA polymerase sigma factor SigW [Tenericutes bacterium ADurb.Bin239]
MSDDKVRRIIALLNEIKRGNMDNFAEFYELTKYQIYYSLISLTKNHELAEDILAETYLRFLDNLKRIKANTNPLGFLLVTARNLAYDYFKKENRVSYIEDFAVESYIGASTTDEYDDSDRLLARMQEILNETEYEVVVLYILGELTHREIAEYLNKPLGTITWTYSNAIKKLQKGLSDYAPNE